MKSPIRYFGGKGGMFQSIMGFFPPKESYKTYIEPFGGAASVLFQKERSPIEIYNDLEKNVYAFFQVLSDKKMFKEFKEKCDLPFYSEDLRKEYKQDLKKDDLSFVDRAYKYFYVNRTSINGVGGFGCSVEFIRRNMSKSVSDFLSSVDKLPEVHNRLSGVVIMNRDAVELIKKYDRKDVFFYLDPPYHQSTRTTTRYAQDMSDDDQKNLIDVLINIKHADVLLSGYDCKLYNTLCKNGWEKIDFNVKTQDGNRNSKTKTESLWRNYKSTGDQVTIMEI